MNLLIFFIIWKLLISYINLSLKVDNELSAFTFDRKINDRDKIADFIRI